MDLMDFIKNNVTIDEVTGCRNWNKSVTSAGYDQFKSAKYLKDLIWYI